MKFNEFKKGMILIDPLKGQLGVVVEVWPDRFKMFVIIYGYGNELTTNVYVKLEEWSDANSWSKASIVKDPEDVAKRYFRIIFEGKVT